MSTHSLWWRVIKDGRTVDCIKAASKDQAMDLASRKWCNRKPYPKQFHVELVF